MRSPTRADAGIQNCLIRVRMGHCGAVSVSARLRWQIESDFPGASDEVEGLLAGVESGNQDR